jgi:hypothetical protein
MPLYPPPATGGALYTNALASPPSSPANGDQWWPSDGDGVTYLRSGGAWAARYRGVPIGGLPPAPASWSWTNQGSATLTASGPGVVLATPSAAGDNWRLVTVATPSTPYVHLAFVVPLFPVDQTWFWFAGWRESSSGKIAGFNLKGVAPGYWEAVKWNSATSFSANYTSTAQPSLIPAQLPLWVRLSDDGTTRTLEYRQTDGAWQTLHSVGRTDFLTPDQLCLGIMNQNGSYTAKIYVPVWG